MTVAFLPERPVKSGYGGGACPCSTGLCVMPEPRSHTRILILPSPNTWANSTLMRPGKKGVVFHFRADDGKVYLGDIVYEDHQMGGCP